VIPVTRVHGSQCLAKFDLIVIDELGHLPMNKQGNYNLFQLINTLYEY